MIRLTALLCLWLTSAVFAQEALEAFDDPTLNERYRDLIQEIRCPKCLNESIAESTAPVASDLRREVRRLIGEGASDDEIKEFLASRYGESVLYRPRLTPATWALWGGPFAFLAIGGIVFWRVLKKRGDQPFDEDLPA